MNRYRTVIILVVCAAMFALGALILFTKPSEEPTSVRKQIAPPVPKSSVKAPSWVEKGQEAQPDYAPAQQESHNATPAPKAPQPVQVIEVTEDRMVSYTFVESLTDFLLNRFTPKGLNGNPETTASAKSLNVYFGRGLDGFNVSPNNIREARNSLFDYAFNPKMLNTLYELYEPAFIAELVSSATNDEREYKIEGKTVLKTLNKHELAIMLKLDATRIEQTAIVMRAIGTDPTITELAAQYLQSAKAVERSNAILQTAMADDNPIKEPSQRLKMAILQRERIKQSMTNTLHKACPGCDDSELFYLAQWGYRRILGEPEGKMPTFITAAELLEKLAERFRLEADSMK